MVVFSFCHVLISPQCNSRFKFHCIQSGVSTEWTVQSVQYTLNMHSLWKVHCVSLTVFERSCCRCDRKAGLYILIVENGNTVVSLTITPRTWNRNRDIWHPTANETFIARPCEDVSSCPNIFFRATLRSAMCKEGTRAGVRNISFPGDTAAIPSAAAHTYQSHNL